MSSPVHSYLRTHRRTWGLTQKELAFLLGRKSPTHVSRLEKRKRAPTVDIVLACEILFGVKSHMIFPTLYEEIEDDVLARAAKLYEELQHKTSRPALRKKEFLSIALKRAITRINQTEGV